MPGKSEPKNFSQMVKDGDESNGRISNKSQKQIQVLVMYTPVI